jgi:hypothetical protein
MARTQQAPPPFSIVTIPIVGAHPLQNFARFQTVTVGPTSTPGQYRYDTPPMNSIAVNTSDSNWLADFSAASGFMAEGMSFKVSCAMHCLSDRPLQVLLQKLFCMGTSLRWATDICTGT